MARFAAFVFSLSLGLSTAVASSDLYHVIINSEQDARSYVSQNPNTFLRSTRGFLVLTETTAGSEGVFPGLESEIIHRHVDRRQLAINQLVHNPSIAKYPLVFEDGGLCVFLVDPSLSGTELRRDGLFRPGKFKPRIATHAPILKSPSSLSSTCEFNSLSERIETDSLMSYVEFLQAYFRRTAGTPESRAARDWIKSRLLDYGCDSVILQPFDADLGGTPAECWNVLGYKTGLTSPERQVIVGAHYDARPEAPGADDNGSGTAAVLEIARALQYEPTDLTFIFALFDAEEWGLIGSKYYADSAAARGDDIELMFNMDMIGYINNDDSAVLFYGFDTAYCDLWSDISGPLAGISGYLWGALPGSDHWWFGQHGYDVIGLREYTWNPFWHTAQDSIQYLCPDYYTRMTQTALSTTYMASHSLMLTADTIVGWAPLTVDFEGSCEWPTDEWQWRFGDGDTASGVSASHTFATRGRYDVELTARTNGAIKSTRRLEYIAVLDDSLTGLDGEVAPQSIGRIPISAINTAPLRQLTIPIVLSGDLLLRIDSVSIAGCRTESLTLQSVHFDPFNSRMTVRITNDGTSRSNLPPGEGTILNLYVYNAESEQSEHSTVISFSGYGSYVPMFDGPIITYQPRIESVTVVSGCCQGLRGNVDGIGGEQITVADLVALVDFMFRGSSDPPCFAEADIDGSSEITIADLTHLVAYMYKGGSPPADCGL